ncbi:MULTISPECIES: DUF3231 family protein [Paenibacillus]|jgi:hypothetical protein|uniref:DUF3231 family protein n=1 Tax=Paenibacillus TaxID=44249 RepID=UPI00040FCE4F|nr:MULTISPECIES: DUF3231 family protein [Paenibacillus]KGP83144.1 membrane protein [Paenibacillus sp. MAEPY2]KGP88541.1 membrane protein [Paenibacillus sp. MAEPY1]OZQ69733.1 hypothetical protein CA599_13515 [Paenibacillus taichungensis]HBU82542.1 DUF3231 domain-containing protein [Paenibacillus sp.]
MGILSGNPKNEPLHYGEIFSVWQCSMVAKGAVSCYQAFLNHAGDKDLKKLLDDLLDQAKLEIKECDTLLTENGIAPAPMLPERPPVKLDDIPAGARFTDPEIAAKLAADTSLGLVAASQVIGQSIREDIGALFAKYHVTKTALGVRILQMNKEKGWLVPPPLQIKRPESDES